MSSWMKSRSDPNRRGYLRYLRYLRFLLGGWVSYLVSRIWEVGWVLCLCDSVVQTVLKLAGIAALFRRVGLEPLAEVAKHSRHQIEGDDHQDDNEQTPRHGKRVTGYILFQI